MLIADRQKNAGRFVTSAKFYTISYIIKGGISVSVSRPVETGRPLVLESFSEIIIFLFDLRIFGGVAFLGCFCGHPAAHGRL